MHQRELEAEREAIDRKVVGELSNRPTIHPIFLQKGAEEGWQQLIIANIF